jgi:hypothetical protein
MTVHDRDIVAEFVDAGAVSLLRSIAVGECAKVGAAEAPAFPPLLHVPRRVPVTERGLGPSHSVMGTWATDNLVDYLRAGPGSSLPTGLRLPEWLCTFGLDGAFPGTLPRVARNARSRPTGSGFEGTGRAVSADDGDYFSELVDWWLRSSDEPDLDERARDNALTAARFAEAWRDADLSEDTAPNAFEMEMRARRMGMVVGDAFTRIFAWSQILLGAEAVKAFNGLVAWWAAALLMPRPFRLGLIDRCLASAGLCAVLAAADAAAPNLARAAAERSGLSRRFPFDGVAYACADGEAPPDRTRILDIVDPMHGIPVLVPIAGHAGALWEMILAVRIGETDVPALFRMPPVLEVRKQGGVVDGCRAAVVTIGEPGPDSGGGGPRVGVWLFDHDTACGDLGGDEHLGPPRAGAQLAKLWRASH